MVALSFVTGVAKIAYFLVPLAWLLLPTACFSSPRSRWLWVSSAIAISIVAGTGWDLYTAEHLYHVVADAGLSRMKALLAPL